MERGLSDGTMFKQGDDDPPSFSPPSNHPAVIVITPTSPLTVIAIDSPLTSTLTPS